MQRKRVRRPLEPGSESPLDAAIVERDRDTLSMVRRALEAGQARLAYQPIVTAQSRRAAFYEGLLRLVDDTGRVIPARDFITKVEDMELGRRLDCRALSLGLRALREAPSLRLAVNMSARSIGYPRWRDILKKHIRNHPDCVERLILEITETSAMGMPEIVIAFMEEFQSDGLTFALDDFGAGATAFRHFRDFSFDILKIDGQFVRGLPENADNQVLVGALLSIARHFDLLAVAESVEDEATAAWLARVGMDCLQGYHFGVPSFHKPWLEQSDRSRKAS